MNIISLFVFKEGEIPNIKETFTKNLPYLFKLLLLFLINAN